DAARNNLLERVRERIARAAPLLVAARTVSHEELMVAPDPLATATAPTLTH
ncbi:MAG: phosphate acyltransferase, partial [Pseudomonadota bacterium]